MTSGHLRFSTLAAAALLGSGLTNPAALAAGDLRDDQGSTG